MHIVPVPSLQEGCVIHTISATAKKVDIEALHLLSEKWSQS